MQAILEENTTVRRGWKTSRTTVPSIRGTSFWGLSTVHKILSMFFFLIPSFFSNMSFKKKKFITWSPNREEGAGREITGCWDRWWNEGEVKERAQWNETAEVNVTSGNGTWGTNTDKIKTCSFGRQRETAKQSAVTVEHCFHVATLNLTHTGSYNKWYPQRTDVTLLKRVYCWQ